MFKVTAKERNEAFSAIRILREEACEGLKIAFDKVRLKGKRGEYNCKVIYSKIEGDYEISYHATKGFRKVRANPFIDRPEIAA